jgi:hypothetical protein
MSVFSYDKKKQFLNNGRIAEEAFAQILHDPKYSSNKEDQIEHWDVKIDVKGMKKISRYDNDKNQHIHWLEIKGITGHNGWVYGEANFFAFEVESYWIVVSKPSLQKFIKDNINKEYRNKEMYYLYQRSGRKDVLTIVSSYDLCYISCGIIKKELL